MKTDEELINREISNMLKNEVDTDAVGEYAEFYLDDIRELLRNIRALDLDVKRGREQEASALRRGSER